MLSSRRGNRLRLSGSSGFCAFRALGFRRISEFRTVQGFASSVGKGSALLRKTSSLAPMMGMMVVLVGSWFVK